MKRSRNGKDVMILEKRRREKKYKLTKAQMCAWSRHQSGKDASVRGGGVEYRTKSAIWEEVKKGKGKDAKILEKRMRAEKYKLTKAQMCAWWLTKAEKAVRWWCMYVSPSYLYLLTHLPIESHQSGKGRSVIEYVCLTQLSIPTHSPTYTSHRSSKGRSVIVYVCMYVCM